MSPILRPRRAGLLARYRFLGLLVPVPGVFEGVYLRIGFGAGLVFEKDVVVAVRI